MNLDDFFYLGKITKTSGFKGELAIYLDVDFPENYFDLKSVMVKTKNTIVPFFFEFLQFRKAQHFKAKFQGVETEEQAMSLVNAELYLPLNQLPPLTGNKFYYHEVIDFTVNDAKDGALGKVVRVIDLPANPLLEVLSDSGAEILVPINDEVVKKVNRADATISVELPEGLLELYVS